jgi:hypothetical protein
VADAVLRAWLALGPGLESLSNEDGSPTSRCFKHVITAFIELRSPKGFNLVHRKGARSREPIGPELVAELDRQLWAALPALRVVNEWVELIGDARLQLVLSDVERKGWQEKALPRAVALAKAGERPTPLAAAEVARQVFTGTTPTDRFVAAIADEASRRAWQQSLDDAWDPTRWAAMPPRQAKRDDVDAVVELLALLDLPPAGQTEEQRDADDRRFDELVEAVHDSSLWWMAGSRARQVGLTVWPEVPPPALGTRWTGTELGWVLDRTLAERLEPSVRRTLRDVPADELIDGEVARAPQPLGLGSPVSRALFCVAIVLANQVDPHELPTRGRPRSRAVSIQRRLFRLPIVQWALEAGADDELESQRWLMYAWASASLWTALANAERRGQVPATCAEARWLLSWTFAGHVRDHIGGVHLAIERNRERMVMDQLVPEVIHAMYEAELITSVDVDLICALAAEPDAPGTELTRLWRSSTRALQEVSASRRDRRLPTARDVVAFLRDHGQGAGR